MDDSTAGLASVRSYDPDDDWDHDYDEDDCTLCGGEGYVECNDPIQCCAAHTTDGLCPCLGCGGSGLAADQRVW